MNSGKGGNWSENGWGEWEQNNQNWPENKNKNKNNCPKKKIGTASNSIPRASGIVTAMNGAWKKKRGALQVAVKVNSLSPIPT